MEKEKEWYGEDAQENDEEIARVEADIIENKSRLKSLCHPFEEDYLFY